MKAKGHWVWLVAKERKLGVNDSGLGVNDSGLRVKAVPRAAAVYDRQLKIHKIKIIGCKYQYSFSTRHLQTAEMTLGGALYSLTPGGTPCSKLVYYFHPANVFYRWHHFQSVKQQRPLAVQWRLRDLRLMGSEIIFYPILDGKYIKMFVRNQKTSQITEFLGLFPQKLMGSTNLLLKIDGFGRTHRTHADGATAV